MLTWSSVQAEFAVQHLGFRDRDIVLVQHPVDQDFFTPMDVERETVFSAGETQRDFPTLIEAARSLGIPTVIAATRVGVQKGLRTTFSDARDQADLPENLTIEGMDPLTLRHAYAAAKVVVVPLVPAQNNAGISVILEAMAMARPVVVSRTVGQVDVVQDGVTGIFVPPGDPVALRAAILELAGDPEAAEAMGRRGRQQVIERHRVDDFVIRIREAALALAD